MSPLKNGFLGWMTLAMAASGCGSGMDPLAALNQGGVLPSLVLPLADALVSTVSPFSQSGSGTASDGFDIQGVLASQSVISPASGVVSFVDLTAGASIVYIVHSLHLQSRISALQSVSVQPGALVQAGSAVGTSSAVNLAVHFTVLYDNTLVCPLSYLTYAMQKRVQTATSGVSPCR
jgi:murein DD-endopeptidase MepM/ murein hydrolase activator NlpD